MLSKKKGSTTSLHTRPIYTEMLPNQALGDEVIHPTAHSIPSYNNLVQRLGQSFDHYVRSMIEYMGTLESGSDVISFLREGSDGWYRQGSSPM